MARHTGKVAVCAGSATGMGAECAFRLATEGAKVVVGDINLTAAEALVERIKAAGGEAVAEAFDIAQEESVNALIQGAAKRYGGLDLMHVNAADLRAVRKDGDALSTDLAIFDRSLAVGLRGHLLCTRAAIPLMQQRGKGAIVYTSSEAAKTAAPSLVSYYVLKAGLNGLMRHVATRWGPEGIRANAICPGVIKTEMTRYLWENPEHVQRASDRVALKRLGAPEEVAKAALYLSTEDSGFTTGTEILVDGGFAWR